MNLLTVATGFCISLFAANSFIRYRDVTHPAVFMAPFFLYFYALWPMILDQEGLLSSLFSDLDKAQLVYFITIVTFFGTMQLPGKFAVASGGRDVFWSFKGLGREDNRKVFVLSIFFGGLALLSYMDTVGGPFGILEAYSIAKGGGHASSGITGEGILLSYPALVLLALYCRMKGRIGASHVLLAL